MIPVTYRRDGARALRASPAIASSSQLKSQTLAMSQSLQLRVSVQGAAWGHSPANLAVSEQPAAHSPMLASLLMGMAGSKQDYASVPTMQGHLQRTQPSNTRPRAAGMSYPWAIRSP